MSFITAPIAAIGSSVLGAFGAIQQGNAGSQAAQYNAAIARQNANIATQQGVAASEAQQRDAQRRIGSMIANYGASGVSVGSGSPLDALADSAAMSTLDNLTVKYNYALKASGFNNQATLEDMKAQSSRTSGLLNAGAFALKGYSSFAGMMGTSIPGFGSGWSAQPDSAETAATASDYYGSTYNRNAGWSS